MDKIDIKEFEPIIWYLWICKICLTSNYVYGMPKVKEVKHCNHCGQTFEIIK